MQLHRQLGISYNAAWRLKHKLMQVMLERDRTKPLSGLVQLDDAYLGSYRSGGKRGRGAAGKTPFVAAVQSHRWGSSPTRQAERGQGIPKSGDRRLGRSAFGQRQSGGVGWIALFQRH